MSPQRRNYDDFEYDSDPDHGDYDDYDQYDPYHRYDPATYEPIEEDPKVETARNLGEWVGVIAVAVIAALLIKAFVIQAFWIPSESMVPTLNVGDRLLVNKLTYKIGDYHHGDIVVFKRPPNEPDENIKDLIKRVVGVPGDTIEAKGGLVYRNNVVIPEKYLPPGTITQDLPKITVEEGQLWLMGDNRTNSADSRFFGAVDQKLVVGKAILRVWPVNQIEILS